mmetsp:Transcript_144841/g.204979  ORF Transcript_144841/g.204979 Transcript_144841/m.204979 type:complete len:104 (+) Transcript_144841:1291-1602(+)
MTDAAVNIFVTLPQGYRSVAAAFWLASKLTIPSAACAAPAGVRTAMLTEQLYSALFDLATSAKADCNASGETAVHTAASNKTADPLHVIAIKLTPPEHAGLNM